MIQLVIRSGLSVALYDSFRVDTTAPTLNLTGPIPGYLNDSTPSFSFNSTEDLKITYAGSCSSAALTAVAGDNEIVLIELSDGSYTDCGLKVRDSVGNTAALSLGSFTVDTVAPSLSVTSSIPLATQDTTPSFSMEASEASTIATRRVVQVVSIRFSWVAMKSRSKNSVREYIRTVRSS